MLEVDASQAKMYCKIYRNLCKKMPIDYHIQAIRRRQIVYVIAIGAEKSQPTFCAVQFDKQLIDTHDQFIVKYSPLRKFSFEQLARNWRWQAATVLAMIKCSNKVPLEVFYIKAESYDTVRITLMKQGATIEELAIEADLADNGQEEGEKT